MTSMPVGLNEGAYQHTTKCDMQAVTLEVQKALGHQKGKNECHLERWKMTTWNLIWA